VLGEIHVPSALFFDLGVFALVLGATMLILTALAHQSVRSHRWADEQAERDADRKHSDSDAAKVAASEAAAPETFIEPPLEAPS
jgi:multicomponent K+:H+ antiporter subunit A